GCSKKGKGKRTLKGLSTEAVKNKKASLGWICRKVRERAVKMIGKRGRVLDLGCGNGLFLAMLGLKGFDKSRVVGIDLSLDLLNEAETVFSSNGQEGIPLIKGDFFNTPFKDGTFDSIVSLNTVVNLEDVDLERLLKEVARVLGPSGRIYLDIRNGDNPFIRWRYLQSSRKRILLVRGYRLNEFRERLKTIGLNVSRIEYIGFKTKTLALAYLLEIRLDCQTI
ncbi:MAG: class I SAM-dependent methyltransferase, partial [Thermodesulfobacteriota bacterium]